MYFDLYTLSLLIALERYIPFMSEEELLRILVYGETPDSATIAVWETMLVLGEGEAKKRKIAEAWNRQILR